MGGAPNYQQPLHVYENTQRGPGSNPGGTRGTVCAPGTPAQHITTSHISDTPTAHKETGEWASWRAATEQHTDLVPHKPGPTQNCESRHRAACFGAASGCSKHKGSGEPDMMVMSSIPSVVLGLFPKKTRKVSPGQCNISAFSLGGAPGHASSG